MSAVCQEAWYEAIGLWIEVQFAADISLAISSPAPTTKLLEIAALGPYIMVLAFQKTSLFVCSLPILTQAATLFAAQSSGDLSTLALTRQGDSYNLSVTSTSRECGGNPSWLNLDSPQRLLYCLDRGQSNVTKGSLNSFRIGARGVLSKIDSVDAPFSGVAAEYFELDDGKRGYVTAS